MKSVITSPEKGIGAGRIGSLASNTPQLEKPEPSEALIKLVIVVVVVRREGTSNCQLTVLPARPVMAL
jgi:hypothetical protein